MKKQLIAIISGLALFFSTTAFAADIPVAGGWTVTADETVTAEAQAAFDKALDGLVGADYIPIALLSTQVVAGTNYCFLCRVTPVVPDPVSTYALVYVYEDLQGEAELLEVKDIEVGLSAFSDDKESVIDWPAVYLASLLPVPDTSSVELTYDSDDEVNIDAFGIDREAFGLYADEVKEAGFSIEAEKDDDEFTGFDENGNKVNLLWTEDKLEIRVYAAVEMTDLVWPEDGMAALIPAPASTAGQIVRNREGDFFAYVRMTVAEEQEYFKLCKEARFDQDVKEYDQYFYAYDTDGNYLSIRYEGAETVAIWIDER